MPFKKTPIDFSKTNIIPAITADYLSLNARLKPFVDSFPEPDSFGAMISRRKTFPINRTVLTEVLKEQNENASRETLANIELLKNDETFTVTTGQQLNLFTGPLYFVYKIISAISLSRTLKEKYPHQNFVPIYWLNGEDHDIEEINHTYLFSKKVEWKTDQRGATGKMKCTGMSEVVEEASRLLGQDKSKDELIQLLKSAYAENNTLNGATKTLVGALFGKYGLVILDPDDARLKKQFTGIIKDDLLNQTAFKSVNKTVAELEKDYKIQVNPREINLFYLDENIRGRIIKEDSTWKVLDTTIQWNEMTLMKEVDEYPEKFSPNVVLRPLYQESILPNVAYVGGPAEVAYWLEYMEMFNHYKVSYPIPVLRSCAMIVDSNSADKLSKLGIAAERLFESEDQLVKGFLFQQNTQFSMEEEKQKISSVYSELMEKVKTVDPSLIGSVEAEKKKNENALKSLEEKIIRAQKKMYDTDVQRIQKLKEKFFPSKSFQERTENFMPFYMKHGPAFFDELLQHLNPLENKFVVLTETGN